MLIAAACIVIATNAGGAWSPMGNVTTILLWLAEKFTTPELIQYAFLPALSFFLTSLGLLYRQLNDTDFVEKETVLEVEKSSKSEKLVVWMTIASFSFPLMMNFIGLPPYIGMFFGVSVVWMMIEVAKRKSHKRRVHLTANMEKIVQSVDVSSILFIIGTLLSVAALLAMGVLAYLSVLLLGQQPTEITIVVLNVSIGVIASVISDSSLVAMAIDIIPSHNPAIWALLSIMAGAGSSMFVIGSAAGVIVSGAVKKLNFMTYLKIATAPVAAGFGVAEWCGYVSTYCSGRCSIYVYEKNIILVK